MEILCKSCKKPLDYIELGWSKPKNYIETEYDICDSCFCEFDNLLNTKYWFNRKFDHDLEEKEFKYFILEWSNRKFDKKYCKNFTLKQIQQDPLFKKDSLWFNVIKDWMYYVYDDNWEFLKHWIDFQIKKSWNGWNYGWNWLLSNLLDDIVWIL